MRCVDYYQFLSGAVVRQQAELYFLMEIVFWWCVGFKVHLISGFSVKMGS